MNEASKPQRKSPRAIFHDYSGGLYFVTICTQDKEHYFGQIHGDAMFHSLVGAFCQNQLEEISTHYAYASIPLYVVMPNHIHAIVSIETDGNSSQRSLLGVVIGGFKREVTLFARRHNIEFAWQGRYHDHIIRGIDDCNRISEYIENNVVRWNADCFYS